VKSTIPPFDAKSSSKKTRNLWLTLAIVGAFSVYGLWTKQNNYYAESKSNISVPSVKTLVSRQNSDGVTEVQFSSEFLEFLISSAQKSTDSMVDARLEQAGLSNIDADMKVEGLYVEAPPHKLAVLRTRHNGIAPTATIFGIVDEELVRVFCSTNSDVDISVTTGECDRTVQETFGVSLGVNEVK